MLLYTFVYWKPGTYALIFELAVCSGFGDLQSWWFVTGAAAPNNIKNKLIILECYNSEEKNVHDPAESVTNVQVQYKMHSKIYIHVYAYVHMLG